MSAIHIEVLTSPVCVSCKEFVLFWESISSDWAQVTMREVSLLTPEGQELALKHRVFASPGIIINEELFASGGFSKKELLNKLQALSLS